MAPVASSVKGQSHADTSTRRGGQSAMTLAPQQTAAPSNAQAVTSLVPPFVALTQRGSDFVVHHVCARCMRPRSLQYHQANPVPNNALPPPSSICGRCKRAEEHGKQTSTALADSARTGAHSARGSRASTHRRSRSEAPTSAGRISIHVIQNAHSGGEAWTARQGLQSVGTGYQISHSLPQGPPIIPNEMPGTPAQLASAISPPITAKRDLNPGSLAARAAPSSRHTASDSVKQKTSAAEENATEAPSARHSNEKEPQTILKSLYGDEASATSPREQIALAQAEAMETLSAKTKAWVASQQSATSVAGNDDKATKISSQKNSSRHAVSVHEITAGVPAPKSEGSIRRIAREEVELYRQAERRLETHPLPFSYGPTRNSPLQVFVSNLHGSHPYTEAIPIRTAAPTDTAIRSSAKIPSSAHRASKTSQKLPSVPESTSSTKQHTSLEVRTGASSRGKEPSMRSAATSKKSEPVPDRSTSTQIPKAPESTESNAKSHTAASNNDTYEITQSMLRHRESFDTDFTVHPDSSISQQPPFGFVEQRRAFRWSTEELPPTLPFPRVESIKTESRKSSSHGSPEAVSPRAAVTVIGPKQSAPEATALASPPPRPPTKAELKSRHSQSSKSITTVDAPPPRPQPPPKADRVAEEQWTYEEQISPDRVRVVRERLIRGRVPSLERFTSSHSSPKPRVKRYEIIDEVRTLPEDRGRARKREGDEAPEERLRSILRSSSNSRSGDRQTRSSSFSRRVSFSEAIDVTLVSPPPSSSQVDDEYEEVSRGKSGRSRRKDRSRKHGFRRYHDDADDDETYYYQRTRRPAKEELDKSAQIPDPKPINRRRALARALSESPSRERGYHILEESEAVEEPRRKPSRTDTEDDTIRSQDPGARRYETPLVAASDGSRIPVVMSGGLSRVSSRATGSTRRHGREEYMVEHPPRHIHDMPPPPTLPYYAEQQTLPPPPLPVADFVSQGRRASQYAPAGSARSPSDFYQSVDTAPSSRRHGPQADVPWPPEGRIVREGDDEHGHWYEVETIERGDDYGGRRPSDHHDYKSRSIRSDGGRRGDRWDMEVEESGRSGRGYDRR